MKIGGPLLDKARRSSPLKWYLSYFVPKKNPDGTVVLNERGRPELERKRPYYKSKEDAEADRPRILAQYATGGTSNSGTGILTRAQTEEYEQAKVLVPEATLVDLAKFWRLHHPLQAVAKLAELKPLFLAEIKARLGETRHYGDLDSRLQIFCRVFGDRLPETVTRDEFMTWLLGLGKHGRTVLNQKRAVVNFFNWLVEKKRLTVNQLAGIKKKSLPKAVAKEIDFLSLVEVNRYLRACERYDPDLVAHEIIQLVAGVRADDEMEDFDGKWVLPQTREIVIPAEIAKTEKREVIDTLEENFWAWWKHYGREGLLRERNYEQRWKRVRVLAAVEDRARADELARLPIKTLLARPESKEALKAWPWNARRRTFCTYHIAKYQSADKTALILRHRGEAYTLHNSYRGLGVKQEQGVAYCAIMPVPIDRPILPKLPARGIIRLQHERRSSGAAPVVDATASA